MIHALYDLVAWAAQPLLRRKLRRRGRAEPGYLQAVEERFGRYGDAPPRPQPAPGAPLVWIHAVSLGETRAAAILLRELRAQWPGMRLLLTHGTATGRAEGARLLQPGDAQVWQPWDTRGATRAFVTRYRPDLGVLMETEIWPNLVRACRRAGVPLVLANARLSEKSLRGARRAAWLLRPAYAGLSAAYAQGEADAERLRAAGAPVAGVLGNLKYDAEAPAALLERGRHWRAQATQPVVMLASSREGEEAEFLRQLKAGAWVAANGAAAAPPQWLLVPRHPQRFDEVAALVAQQGLDLSRRSIWGEGAEGRPQAAAVWLGDSLGEMPAYYALADVALLGGSFEPLGGQNLIEAAACGCPVVMGPHTFNFAEAAEHALAAGAALRVANLAEGLAVAAALARDEARRARMAAAGQAFARQHQGAARRTVEALRDWVDAAAAPGR
ncbi:MAG TPA: 3-deoxy-D-manno-octulosonic acid transferase [Ottowia sp.]|uniref:3-deoxy-D-manno-octulosonic acid transferase n=1 Tax=Ottowia sp. TaxID=1898956 RepID=UPI002CF2F227|nr:3-deoxy-D-manno-octulosonic acid transferase [Ottowia sp.]HMN21625.1 3-deoxy-D-manno-octulosonic acid transferase [Ottowia sp.]